MEEVVYLLKSRGESISTMESCTGGGVANAITNIAGASNIFSFGAVTYANEYKIRFGVNREVIDKYSVYSREVAHEMSKSIADYADSTYGVGVTGKLLRKDDNNPYGEDNVVYVSVYDRRRDKYYEDKVVVGCNTREENKMMVIDKVALMVKDILSSEAK